MWTVQGPVKEYLSWGFVPTSFDILGRKAYFGKKASHFTILEFTLGHIKRVKLICTQAWKLIRNPYYILRVKASHICLHTSNVYFAPCYICGKGCRGWRAFSIWFLHFPASNPAFSGLVILILRQIYYNHLTCKLISRPKMLFPQVRLKHGSSSETYHRSIARHIPTVRRFEWFNFGNATMRNQRRHHQTRHRHTAALPHELAALRLCFFRECILKEGG